MGKYDGCLLMSDFDGTLAVRAVIGDENMDALNRFMSEGGLFSLATGRFPDILSSPGCTVRPNTYCPMLNGALLFSPGEDKIIDCLPVDREKAKRFTETFLAECPETSVVGMHSESGYFPFRPDDAGWREYDQTLTKIVFRVPTEQSDAYFETARRLGDGDFLITRSWVNGIELLCRGAGKGDRLRQIKQMLGDRAAVTVAVGDYENDISMIEAADVGYAVGDAVPSVLAAADRVTVRHTEGAIARIIEELI